MNRICAATQSGVGQSLASRTAFAVIVRRSWPPLTRTGAAARWKVRLTGSRLSSVRCMAALASPCFERGCYLTAPRPRLSLHRICGRANFQPALTRQAVHGPDEGKLRSETSDRCLTYFAASFFGADFFSGFLPWLRLVYGRCSGFGVRRLSPWNFAFVAWPQMTRSRRSFVRPERSTSGRRMAVW